VDGVQVHGVVKPLEIERRIPLTTEEAWRANATRKDVEPRSRFPRIERAMNLVLASIALVLVSPVMLALAALVKITSRGPILYSQPRVGLDRRRRSAETDNYDRRTRDLGGAPFMIYKFRTMYVGAEPGRRAVWAKEGDPRVTPVGGLMRKLRVDELPQLFNVVKGDMNIVGPRPERPSIFSRLRHDVVDYPLRQRTRPGITGWAQINQSYDTNLDDVRRKVRYDLEYLERKGVREDLRIMAKTLPVVFLRRGGW
jgi:lipopolysaccharide/colanic/teichoic acid biosynthesis glycosyltransferase